MARPTGDASTRNLVPLPTEPDYAEALLPAAPASSALGLCAALPPRKTSGAERLDQPRPDGALWTTCARKSPSTWRASTYYPTSRLPWAGRMTRPGRPHRTATPSRRTNALINISPVHVPPELHDLQARHTRPGGLALVFQRPLLWFIRSRKKGAGRPLARASPSRVSPRGAGRARKQRSARMNCPQAPPVRPNQAAADGGMKPDVLGHHWTNARIAAASRDVAFRGKLWTRGSVMSVPANPRAWPHRSGGPARQQGLFDRCALTASTSRHRHG